MTKLSEDQIKEMQELYMYHGKEVSYLSKRYHTSVNTILKHVKDKKKIESPIVEPEKYKGKGYYLDRRKQFAKQLIESMADFAMTDNWTEEFLMQQLISCGLTRMDFVNAGYKPFFESYYECTIKDRM